MSCAINAARISVMLRTGNAGFGTNGTLSRVAQRRMSAFMYASLAGTVGGGWLPDSTISTPRIAGR